MRVKLYFGSVNLIGPNYLYKGVNDPNLLTNNDIIQR